MLNKVRIAIDAMGGIDSPKKIIDGIEISLKTNQENFFTLYGKKDLLEKEISKKKNIHKYCEIINAEDIVYDDESAFSGAKKSKNTSMWKAVESLSDVSKTSEVVVITSLCSSPSVSLPSELILFRRNFKTRETEGNIFRNTRM